MKICLYCFGNLYQPDSIYEIFVLRKTRRIYLCKICLANLISIQENEKHTSCCQKLINSQVNYCRECDYWKQEYQINIYNKALFRYNDFALAMLWRIKHNRDIMLAKVFVPIMKNYVYHTYNLSQTLFVSIPSDVYSLQIRRFSLVDYVLSLLTSYIKVAAIFPTITDIKQKQHKKNKQERLLYAQERFVINSNVQELLVKHNIKEIVIVDDVYTTGSTIAKAMNTIKLMSDTKTSSFTIFR